MEISPAENKVGGFVEAVPTEVREIQDEAIDICRICQSPEEVPDNPLKHPCACRGSLKYVHTDCLFLWINRRKLKHCEICKHSYSVVPVYSENAPERLPCHEFLMGLLLRALRFMHLILPWVLVIPFNSYCFSLRLRNTETDSEKKRVFRVPRDFPGLFYTAEIVSSITFMVFLRVLLDELVRRHPEILRRVIFIENGLRQRDVAGIVLFLGTYFHILIDWWHDQLLHLPFVHIFERGPLALAFVPRNTQLHEFGVIRRFLFLLDDNTFAVLAINIYLSSLNVLLPFSIGRAVLVLVRVFRLGWIGANLSEVIVGYMVILSGCLAYVGRACTLPRNTSPTSIRWPSLSVKYAILYLKTGVLPCILGCWLDFCTFSVTGPTVSNRLEVPPEYLFMAAKYLCIGMLYLAVALRFMELIQKIVQKRAFWYLLDVTEPNYNITKLYLGPILLAFAFHGTVAVIVLHLPIKTITLSSPSFFPLQFGVYKDELVIGLLVAYVSIIGLGPRWLANFINPSIRTIVHKWVTTVSSWLKLSDFLLGVPQRARGNHNVRPLFRAFGIAEGSMVSLYGTVREVDTNDKRDKRLMVRIGVMLVLAALSMFLVSTIFMALPILVGRVFFHSISFGIKHDGLLYIHLASLTHLASDVLKVFISDICAFVIGFCILRGIYINICFVYDHIVTGRTDLLLNHVMMFIRKVLLFSIWISVIPGMIGLLIDLMIIIPIQVPLHEPPVYSLLQSWLVGVVVLHIWISLTMLTQNNCFATVEWREKLQRIKTIGINRLPLTWLIRDVIGSVIVTLLISLFVPYVLVNYLFPLFGFSTALNLSVQRLIWPAMIALILIWLSAKPTRDLIIYLHQVEFDSRYQVGERLVDFIQDLE